MPENDGNSQFSDEYLDAQLSDLEARLSSEDPALARNLEQLSVHISFAEKLHHQANFIKASVVDTFCSEKVRRRTLGLCGGALVCLSLGVLFNRQGAISDAKDQQVSTALHEDLNSFTQHSRMTQLDEAGTRLALFYRHHDVPFECGAVGSSLTHYFTSATDETKVQPYSNTTYTMLPFEVSKIGTQEIANADNPDLLEPFCDEPSDLSPSEERVFAILDNDFKDSIGSLNDGDYSAEFYGLGLDHRAIENATSDYKSSQEYVKQRAIQIGGTWLLAVLGTRMIIGAIRRRKY